MKIITYLYLELYVDQTAKIIVVVFNLQAGLLSAGSTGEAHQELSKHSIKSQWCLIYPISSNRV